MRQQDDLSVRELKRVVMTARLIPVDLAETGHLVAERAGNDEPGFAFYLVFKGKLQTYTTYMRAPPGAAHDVTRPFGRRSYATDI